MLKDLRKLEAGRERDQGGHRKEIVSRIAVCRVTGSSRDGDAMVSKLDDERLADASFVN